MRRRWMVLLALVGCVNPDEIFPVSGTVASVDPVAGQVVRLLRRPHQTPYGSCDGTGLGPFKEVVADADGGYGFEVFRAQALGLTTNSQGGYCMQVRADFPSGSSAWADFSWFISGPTVVVPLRDWRAAPEVVDEVLRFEPPIPWPDDAAARDGSVVAQLDHQVVLLSGDGGVVWKAGDRVAVAVREALRLDGPRLEDFSGTASLRALLWEPVDQPQGPGNLQAWSTTELRAGQTVAFAGRRVPVSRGLPCPEVATPCPLTDGDLTVVDVGGLSGVTLALGAPATLSAVVLRGVSSGSLDVAVLLGQVDGGQLPPTSYQLVLSAFDPVNQDWTPVWVDGGWVSPEVRAQGLYSVLALDAGVPVARVTLWFPGGLQRIAEVSLFE